jgi:hypothetical protein
MAIASSLATRWFTFYRRTAYILEATTAAATLSLTYSVPSGGSYIQITVSSGTTGSGTVTVNGTDTSGSSTSQVLTFTANGTQVTTTKFATVTSLATTGLSDEAAIATVSARSVSADGTSNLVSTAVATNRPAWFSFSGQPNYPALTQGTNEMDAAYIRVDKEEVWTPKVDDIATDIQTSDQWVVRAVRDIRVGYGMRTEHYLIRASRYTT